MRLLSLISIIPCLKTIILEENPTAKAELLKLIAAMQEAGFPNQATTIVVSEVMKLKLSFIKTM